MEKQLLEILLSIQDESLSIAMCNELFAEKIRLSLIKPEQLNYFCSTGSKILIARNSSFTSRITSQKLNLYAEQNGFHSHCSIIQQPSERPDSELVVTTHRCLLSIFQNDEIMDDYSLILICDTDCRSVSCELILCYIKFKLQSLKSLPSGQIQSIAQPFLILCAEDDTVTPAFFDYCSNPESLASSRPPISSSSSIESVEIVHAKFFLVNRFRKLPVISHYYPKIEQYPSSFESVLFDISIECQRIILGASGDILIILPNISILYQCYLIICRQIETIKTSLTPYPDIFIVDYSEASVENLMKRNDYWRKTEKAIGKLLSDSTSTESQGTIKLETLGLSEIRGKRHIILALPAFSDHYSWLGVSHILDLGFSFLDSDIGIPYQDRRRTIKRCKQMEFFHSYKTLKCFYMTRLEFDHSDSDDSIFRIGKGTDEKKSSCFTSDTSTKIRGSFGTKISAFERKSDSFGGLSDEIVRGINSNYSAEIVEQQREFAVISLLNLHINPLSCDVTPLLSSILFPRSPTSLVDDFYSKNSIVNTLEMLTKMNLYVNNKLTKLGRSVFGFVDYSIRNSVVLFLSVRKPYRCSNITSILVPLIEFAGKNSIIVSTSPDCIAKRQSMMVYSNDLFSLVSIFTHFISIVKTFAIESLSSKHDEALIDSQHRQDSSAVRLESVTAFIASSSPISDSSPNIHSRKKTRSSFSSAYSSDRSLFFSTSSREETLLMTCFSIISEIDLIQIQSNLQDSKTKAKANIWCSEMGFSLLNLCSCLDNIVFLRSGVIRIVSSLHRVSPKDSMYRSFDNTLKCFVQVYRDCICELVEKTMKEQEFVYTYKRLCNEQYIQFFDSAQPKYSKYILYYPVQCGNALISSLRSSWVEGIFVGEEEESG
ncbi:hypothetical protein ADUPG1_008995 [Aduncisulcus paluster]|uniref:Uncharacterized protein n=1 Tax=Aduncisulcus paluster TaxID=2918883 RepID=A0ABQ5KU11_9EUKA|nr:hypothetical protein ADUPG1_008995 [Aduncisulcus paluster]